MIIELSTIVIIVLVAFIAGMVFGVRLVRPATP